MLIAGYMAALLIGLSLGLIGGGGSILTVPILVYLFDVPPVLATSYSLFIVGITSLVGSVANLSNKTVDMKTVLIFGTLSVITVFCIRHYIIPYLPQSLHIGYYSVPVSLVTMLLFAVLMIASSFSMIKTGSKPVINEMPRAGLLKISVYGISIGLVTGLLGAGGGFLLIPALILLLRLPVKTAIGTSLVIITVNSLAGFADDVTHHSMDWDLLLKVTGIAVVGVLAGAAMGKKIKGGILKRAFGWFVLLIGIYVVVHELVIYFTP
ncbi:sulfite exporter TauE/SafE family protein [Niabella aquatica]